MPGLEVCLTASPLSSQAFVLARLGGASRSPGAFGEQAGSLAGSVETVNANTPLSAQKIQAGETTGQHSGAPSPKPPEQFNLQKDRLLSDLNVLVRRLMMIHSELARYARGVTPAEGRIHALTSAALVLGAKLDRLSLNITQQPGSKDVSVAMKAYLHTAQQFSRFNFGLIARLTKGGVAPTPVPTATFHPTLKM